MRHLNTTRQRLFRKLTIGDLSLVFCALSVSIVAGVQQNSSEPSSNTVEPASETVSVGRQDQPETTGNVQSVGTTQQSKEDTVKAAQPTFDGETAFETLKKVCAIGTRVSGSAGMRTQQQMLKTHFESLGGQVYLQKFNVRHPNNGAMVELANLAVRFHPDRKKRLLICCHYDTRPFPDLDKVNPRGTFLGANDGASGVALLHELGKHMPGLEGKYGVDFVFFDGEEFVYVYRRDPMFLGSTFFANQYAAGQWPAKYTYAILVDMIGDKNLEIYYEGNSMEFAPRLTRSIWAVADRLGVKSFIKKERHKIRDDHLPLNSIARIPSCDIIDFDYPTIEMKNAYWHTEQDIPENCSADSLTQVGWVVLEWLKEMEKLN